MPFANAVPCPAIAAMRACRSTQDPMFQTLGFPTLDLCRSPLAGDLGLAAVEMAEWSNLIVVSCCITGAWLSAAA